MKRLLIIEDDELTVTLLLNALRRFELEIFHAPTAYEGLDLAQQHQPNLILLDMRLPGMNGWEFATILKQDIKLSLIPIVAVSVPVSHNDADFAIASGCDDYIPKPFNIQNLRECVAAYVS